MAVVWRWLGRYPRDVWQGWSSGQMHGLATSPHNYHEKANEGRWKSLNNDKANIVTTATMLKIAKEKYGWVWAIEEAKQILPEEHAKLLIELSELSPLAYGLRRRKEAKKLDISVGLLDQCVSEIKKNAKPDNGTPPDIDKLNKDRFYIGDQGKARVYRMDFDD